MTLLSFILILCAIGVAGYGVSKIQDLNLRYLFFAVLVVCTIFFLLAAAGLIGSAPLHL